MITIPVGKMRMLAKHIKDTEYANTSVDELVTDLIAIAEKYNYTDTDLIPMVVNVPGVLDVPDSVKIVELVEFYDVVGALNDND